MWHDSFICDIRLDWQGEDLRNTSTAWRFHQSRDMPMIICDSFIKSHMKESQIFIKSRFHQSRDMPIISDSFTCDMTHSCGTWLIHMWHDSFICDMTHSYVTWLIHMWHDSFICDTTHSYVTWLIHTWYAYYQWLIHMWHVTWLTSPFNRALLQKRPIIESILLTKATPY